LRYVRAITLALATAAVLAVGLAVGLAGGLTEGQARAATAGATPVPLVPPPGGGTLTQTSADTWTTDVYLDTGALCDPVSFDLVTGTPDTETAAAKTLYDGAPTPPCGAAAQAAQAVTDVALTFTPSLSSVPQSAALVVTPSAAALAAGAAPLDIALTVRRQVTVVDYIWIPLGCGVLLAVLLVALAATIGVPETGAARLRGSRIGFWRSPLYASSAWTFGSSPATNFSALSALIGTVLAASGTVAGLVPGVDLGRVGLLFAVAGAFAVIAPQLFAMLNTRLGGADPSAPAAASGEIATRMWIMLVASCCTAFGVGAEIGLVGWVLGLDLATGPLWVRICIAIATFLVALLFLVDGILSILAMTRVPPLVITRIPALATTTGLDEAAAPRVRAARTSFLL
jgi:hypothetical protein